MQGQALPAPTQRWQRDLGGIIRQSSPLGVDLTGDGLVEVMVGTRDNRLWALRGRDGATVPGWPQPTSNKINSSPAADDTDRDGRPEVFIGVGVAEEAAAGGSLDSFDHDGRRRYTLNATDNTFARPAVHSTPALGDITGDGSPDVSFGTLGIQSVWAITQGGRRHAGFPFFADDTVFSSPALADVNGDGRTDMIIGADATPGGAVNHRGGLVWAIDGSGRRLWEYRINDVVGSSPSVGDIDGDGRSEIVFGAGNFYGGSDRVKVFALSLNGALKPGWPQSTDGVTLGSPALADLDGDGRRDVVIGTSGSGVSVYAWRGNGQRMPGFPRPSGGGVVIGSIVTADLVGDGGQDVIVPTGGGFFAYSGLSGTLLFGLQNGQVGFQNSALLADADGNGRLDLITAGTRRDNRGVVTRFELGPEARLGERGWHQWRRDNRRSGAALSAADPRDIFHACPAGRVPEDGFGDVPPSNLHEPAIDCAVWWSIAAGTSAGRYSPGATVRRDQMATFLARLIEESGGTLPEDAPDRFRDDDGTFHEPNINKLAAVGIVSGRADGTYGPEQGVDRGQMATFLVRAFEHRSDTALVSSIDYFLDDEGSAHEPNINKAAGAGFTGGQANGSYGVAARVARDQMASFLARVLAKLVDDGHAPLPS